jgi:hypothetical protein
MRKLIFLALVLFWAGPAFATPLLGERSPVRPGLWWDAERAGSGFDVQVAGRHLLIIWYTYRADGAPVWYTAHGELDAQGQLDTDWLEHRWGGEPERVGRAVFERINQEQLQLDWGLGNGQGRLVLTPLPVAAVIPERDRSGAFHEPARSGYGVTLAEQGSWRVLAMYAFDADGRPTWVLGNNDGAGDRVELLRFEGACPACPYRASSNERFGVAEWLFDSDTQMRLWMRQWLDAASGALAPEFVVDAQALEMLSTPAAQRAADRQLARFADDADLLATLKRSLLETARFRLPPPTPPCATCSPPGGTPMANFLSTTNVIEDGVDEADIIKSDGEYIYAFDLDTQMRLAPVIRPARMASDPLRAEVAQPFSLMTLRLGAALAASPPKVSMYLTDDTLVALSSDEAFFQRAVLTLPCPVGVWAFTDGRGRLLIEMFDRSNPLRPQSRWRAVIDGYLVASRRIGNQLYIVHRSSHGPENLETGTDAASIQRNRERLENLSLDALLPTISIDNGLRRPLLGANRVLLPPLGARLLTPEYAVVTRINIANPDDRESIAILGGAEATYVSSQALYVATTRTMPEAGADALLWPQTTATEVHRIALTADGLRVDGTGVVEGWVGRDAQANAFRFSEHEGRLRLLTEGDFGEMGRYRVHVLEPSAIAPGLLTVRGQVPSLERPAPIGRPGERLFATRFVGDSLYASTFEVRTGAVTDPFYVIDLADPFAPRIAGEIEFPGIVHYLHPLPGGRMLGVGYDLAEVPSSNWVDHTGIQLTLFDVSDASAPQLMDRFHLGEQGSWVTVRETYQAFSAVTLDDGRVRFAFPAVVSGDRLPTNKVPGPYRAWTETGLYVFDVPTDAPLIEPVGALIAASRGGGPGGWIFQGRGLLASTGAWYVHNGRYWSAPWTNLESPAGPR